MRSQTYFILAALIDGPLHGYAIIKRAQDLSGGRVRLAAGTLYGALDRLTTEGLVHAGEPYIEAGRARRDYELTDDGASALAAEADRLATAARTVKRHLAARVVGEGA